MRELCLEGVRCLLIGEVAAERIAGLAEGVRHAVDQLADAPLAEILVAVDAGLAEVLGDRDVRRELTPAFGDLRPFQLEDDRAVRVGDLAVSEDVLHRVERVGAGLGQLAFHR